jgi:hypothetical protein
MTALPNPSTVDFGIKSMMSFLDLLLLVAGFVSAGLLFMVISTRQVKMGALAVLFAIIMVGGMAQPSLAAAVNDDVLTEGQADLQETLQTTPHGNQYQGIEYAPDTSAGMSDREITERIRSEIPDNLKLSVSNGAVRLSGKVANRRDAQAIVQSIKEVPGVHEISYDLGLAS